MIQTIIESVGVPEDVFAKTPIMERTRIPMAKVQFKLENGMRMTIIDRCKTTDICLLFLTNGLIILR